MDRRVSSEARPTLSASVRCDDRRRTRGTTHRATHGAIAAALALTITPSAVHANQGTSLLQPGSDGLQLRPAISQGNPVAPTVWTINPSDGGARTLVLSEDGLAFSIVCNRASPRINQMRFYGYRGDRLSTLDGAAVDAMVLIEGGGDGLSAFETAFAYDARAEAWSAPMRPRGAMAPAIAKGATLSITVDGWEIGSFSLRGSSTAYNALLDACIQ